MCDALKTYLAEKKLSVSDLAAGIGVPHPTASRYVNGIRIPRKREMAAIYMFTAGEVRPDDFYDLPDLSSSSSAAAPDRVAALSPHVTHSYFAGSGRI